MSPYVGGSAPAMAAQVTEGYTLLTAATLKRLSSQEMDQLVFELERTLRDLRAAVVPQDDQPAVQARNRKLSRLVSTLSMIQAQRARRKV